MPLGTECHTNLLPFASWLATFHHWTVSFKKFFFKEVLYFMICFTFEKFSPLLLYLHDNLTGYNLLESHILFLGTLLTIPRLFWLWIPLIGMTSQLPMPWCASWVPEEIFLSPWSPRTWTGNVMVSPILYQYFLELGIFKCTPCELDFVLPSFQGKPMLLYLWLFSVLFVGFSNSGSLTVIIFHRSNRLLIH